jgi:predicted double-glycine peptidase
MQKESVLALALLLFLAPAFCSTAPVQPDAGTVVISDVPFFSQEGYQCGPTALAIVMDYWQAKTGAGKWVAPEEIASAIYSPSAKGVLGIDLEVYAQKHGFAAEQYSGGIDDLRERIDRGTPPIIFVDYGLLSYEMNHFMVVTGYTRDGVIVHSGRFRNRSIPAGQLDKIWRKNRYWTLLLKPSV